MQPTAGDRRGASARLADNDARFIRRAREWGAADWATASLCAGWTNHDVLAHLVVGCRTRLSVVVSGIVAHRGSFDRANSRMAHELAARCTPAELLGDLDRLRLAPEGIGRAFPKGLLLGDHVIHELDMVFALGQEPGIPSEVLAAVLHTEVTVANPFVPARRRARGLTLRATDTDWEHHDGARRGPLVTGAAADLASVLAGRARAVPRLSGPGLERLSRHLG